MKSSHLVLKLLKYLSAKIKGSKFIPKQAAFGFGGCYKTCNIYVIIVVSREKISNETAKLFLSLNPSVKIITLRHEMTGNIFKLGGKV